MHYCYRENRIVWREEGRGWRVAIGRGWWGDGGQLHPIPACLQIRGNVHMQYRRILGRASVVRRTSSATVVLGALRIFARARVCVRACVLRRSRSRGLPLEGEVTRLIWNYNIIGFNYINGKRIFLFFFFFWSKLNRILKCFKVKFNRNLINFAGYWRSVGRNGMRYDIIMIIWRCVWTRDTSSWGNWG